MVSYPTLHQVGGCTVRQSHHEHEPEHGRGQAAQRLPHHARNSTTAAPTNEIWTQTSVRPTTAGTLNSRRYMGIDLRLTRGPRVRKARMGPSPSPPPRPATTNASTLEQMLSRQESSI